jgi:hypothetical protein
MRARFLGVIAPVSFCFLWSLSFLFLQKEKEKESDNHIKHNVSKKKNIKLYSKYPSYANQLILCRQMPATLQKNNTHSEKSTIYAFNRG